MGWWWPEGEVSAKGGGDDLSHQLFTKFEICKDKKGDYVNRFVTFNLSKL